MKINLSYLISDQTRQYIHEQHGRKGIDNYCRQVLCEQLIRQIKDKLVYSITPAKDDISAIKCQIEIKGISSNFGEQSNDKQD